MGETSRGRIYPKFRGDLLECSVVAKAHVDPRNSCTSTICVSVHAFNALPEVGAPLEIEVVSQCIDGGIDGTGYADGLPAIGGAGGTSTPPLETSVCLGGAALGRAFFPGTPEGSAAGVFYGPKDGRIKVSCDDGTAKTKGNYEYLCRRLPD